MTRWSLILKAYEYTIEYKPGKSHGNADSLSRVPIFNIRCNYEEHMCLMLDELDSSPFTSDDVKFWTSRDPLLAHVREFVLRGWPEKPPDESYRPFFRIRNELTVVDGCIVWGTRVVIPPQGRTERLRELHVAHPGMNRMKGLARSYVWWPSMDAEIENKVRCCDVCQQNQKSPAKAPLHSWEVPNKPWTRVHIDYAEYEKYNLLIIVDAYSKWIEAHRMTSITSAATILKLKQVFATLGIPEILASDNGSNFTSDEFSHFLNVNGITQILVALYHPSSNGLAERAVEIVKNGLNRVKDGTIDERLAKILFRYRIIPQSRTQVSSAELLMKRKLRSRLAIDSVHPQFNKTIVESQRKMKVFHDQNVKERQFSIGDTVWTRSYSYGSLWVKGKNRI
uniref:Uncharacterized protein K02A2.6-like n=1 Tax=Saccoglossus kowalevskii TaxID=10224 RepID=A0ABM0LYY2_SACKO|nr:PREDICTED: uncharacterized protein K02A2.6-like [Saccoglossus kowalevskii]